MAGTLHVQVNLKSSPDDDATLTIGDLAAPFGLATHVIRHWEDLGLIEPAVRVKGRRYYREAHIARVTTILRGKQAGLSLRQIGGLLATPRSGHTEMLRRHRAALDEQIEQIEAAKALLDHMIECHADDVTECVEFQAVARAAAPRRASVPARTP
jgi:DNA-binding transcriptional MerR regulator